MIDNFAGLKMRPKFCDPPKMANSKHSNIEKLSTHAKIIQKKCYNYELALSDHF